MKKIYTFLTFILLMNNANSQNLEWAEKTPNCAFPNSMEVFSNNDILSVSSSRIIKYTNSGSQIYLLNIGVNNNVKIDNSDNFYVFGSFNGTRNFNPLGPANTLSSIGQKDYFLAKYNQSGLLLWAFNVGFPNASSWNGSMSIDGNGNVIVNYNDFVNGTYDIDPLGTSAPINTNNSSNVLAKYNGVNGVLITSEMVNYSPGMGMATSLNTNKTYAISAGGDLMTFDQNLTLTSSNPINFTNSTNPVYDVIISNDDQSLYILINYLANTGASNEAYRNEVIKLDLLGNIIASHSESGFTSANSSPFSFLSIKEDLNGKLYVLQSRYPDPGLWKFDSSLGNLEKILFEVDGGSSGSLPFILRSFALTGESYVLGGSLPVNQTVDFDVTSNVNALTTSTFQCDIIPTAPGFGFLAKYCFLPPTPSIIGDSIICGSSLNVYTVNSQADVSSYNWTLPVGWSGSSNTDSISLYPNNSSGFLFVNSSNLCGNSINDSINITVDVGIPPAPTSLVGDQSFCPNSNHIYSCLPVSNANSYLWVLPNGWTGSSSTNSIDATATLQGESGIISVSGVNSCGVSSAATITLTSDVDNSVSYDALSSTITANQLGATYQWVQCTNNTFTQINGENAQNFTPTVGGEYAVEINYNNCLAISPCTLVGFASINEVITPLFSLYPNPTSQNVTIQLMSQSVDSDLRILSITGKEVLSVENAFVNTSNVEINVSHLTPGIYLVKVGNATQRLVIE